jgi:hypothetical protein
MIVQDFENQMKQQEKAKGRRITSSYIIPPSLEFLAKNVQERYPELWKSKTNQRAFLPAQWPADPTNPYGNRNSNSIVLMPADKIFKSPTCSYSTRLF